MGALAYRPLTMYARQGGRLFTDIVVWEIKLFAQDHSARLWQSQGWNKSLPDSKGLTLNYYARKDPN